MQGQVSQSVPQDKPRDWRNRADITQVNTLQPQITQELLCMGRGIYKGKEKAIDLQSEVSSLIGSN